MSTLLDENRDVWGWDHSERIILKFVEYFSSFVKK